MPVVDVDAPPQIMMRAGVAESCFSGHDQRAASVGVLRNWVTPVVSILRHLLFPHLEAKPPTGA